MSEEIVKPAEQARQGRTGVGVRYVLVISVALAVVALALTAFFHAM